MKKKTLAQQMLDYVSRDKFSLDSLSYEDLVYQLLLKLIQKIDSIEQKIDIVLLDKKGTEFL